MAVSGRFLIYRMKIFEGRSLVNLCGCESNGGVYGMLLLFP